MITSQRILDFLRFCLFLSSGLGMRSLKLQLPEDRPSGSLQDKGSQAGVLAVIHKSGKAGKAVISAGMPKSRPWTVASRLYKCLIQVTCQPVASWTWIQGHLSQPIVCHPWTLDSGIPDRNDDVLWFPSSSLGTRLWKLCFLVCKVGILLEIISAV